MLKTLLLCLFVGQIVASPYHREKRSVCSSKADCNDQGTCTGGKCDCDLGYSGDTCENQCFPADIFFVLDESGSVTQANWDKQVAFTKELINIFPIDPDKVRVGFNTFSSKVNEEFQLKESDKADDFNKALEGVKYGGGSTNTPDAIDRARTQSFSKSNGDRIENPAVPNFMIIMTDGKISSSYESKFPKSAAILRASTNIEVFVIGISSGVNETQLEMMASLPVADHKFLVSDFSLLGTVKDKLTKAICKASAAKANPCDKKPCHDAGTDKCVNGGSGKFTCECKPGYVGDKCETKCGVADIAWIIDSSGSIGAENYKKQMQFIHDFVDKLDISPTASQIAASSFGLTGRKDFDFKKYQSKGPLLDAIDKIPYMSSWTNTSGGMYFAIKDFFTPAGGDRIDKPNIAIVITDGGSNRDKDLTVPYADELRKTTALGVSVFCLGVGNGIVEAEVHGIASKPLSDFYIKIDSYDEINKHLNKILLGTCKTSDADHCASGPCQNGGSCKKIANGYQCTCVAGWTGQNCQTNIDDCKPTNPCKNGGSCADGINSYTCTCASGWSGKNCDTPVDHCKPTNPCVHGTCATVGNTFKCTCNQGYTGVKCDTLINFCQPNPCQNGGTCTSSISGAKCACKQGYTGSKCETLINFCQPNPCQNGGQCTSSTSGAKCTCVNNYTGDKCQTAPSSSCDKVDICFVIDGSASIGSNWDKQLQFIVDFAKKFDYGDKARMGAIDFSADVDLQFSINDNDSPKTIAEFETKIKAIPHRKKSTNTYFGLDLVPDCGWRQESGIKRLVVVITDGVSSDPTRTINTANTVRESAKAEIHAVGIANANDQELNGIAGVTTSRPGKVYKAPSFSDLGHVANDLAAGTCNIPDTSNSGCSKADIAFVVDSSASISRSNWDIQVQFLVDFANQFEIADDKTKIGQVTFSTSAEISFPISGANSATSKQDFETKTKAVTQMRKGTYTNLGLDLVLDAGMQWRNDNSVKKIAIVVTDGKSASFDNTKTAADKLRAQGITVHCLGVKITDTTEADAISGKGTAKAGKTFIATDFSDLSSIIKTIRDGICTAADPCSPNPCQNGGSCSKSGSSYTCTCTGGYTGNNCQTAPNPCSPNPCQNGGTCNANGNAYTCTCTGGYTGNNCQTAPAPCSPNPCQNGGTCNANGNAYTCTCTGGYTGNNCQTAPNPCSPNPCQNGGTCNANGNAYTCTCTGGYTGNNCQTAPNPCSPNPCQNGGTCNANGNAYTCTCTSGFTGNNCQTPDPCGPKPCQNGGTCNANGNSYTCTCINGYTGNNCQTPPDPCGPKPCQNGGTCNANGNAYTCTCINGYTGNNCQTAPTGCAVCSGNGCVAGNMDAAAVIAAGGSVKSGCKACYTKKNKDGSYARGCVDDVPEAWKTDANGKPQLITTNIPESGGSVCYPIDDDNGEEVCFCKGSDCNMGSFTSVAGGSSYSAEEITCKCPTHPCPNNNYNKDVPFKCYKDSFVPKCDCENCDCLGPDRKKRWISWLW